MNEWIRIKRKERQALYGSENECRQQTVCSMNRPSETSWTAHIWSMLPFSQPSIWDKKDSLIILSTDCMRMSGYVFVTFMHYALTLPFTGLNCTGWAVMCYVLCKIHFKSGEVDSYRSILPLLITMLPYIIPLKLWLWTAHVSPRKTRRKPRNKL